MLTQDGFQAWLADEDGFEIANLAPSYNGLNDMGAVVPIDAAKRSEPAQKYVVHWKAMSVSARESWWCQVASFCSGEKSPRYYNKRATHWMDKNDPKTHLRTSNRLMGKFKDTGLLSPEIHSPKQGIRLAFRRAEINQRTNTVDQDGYANPECVLLRNKFTPPDVVFRFYLEVKATAPRRSIIHEHMRTRATKRLSDASSSASRQLTTPELSGRPSKRRKLTSTTSTVIGSSQRENTESKLTSPLSSDDDRGDTPANLGLDLRDCKIKVEQSAQDLRKVSNENERLEEFERTLAEIEKNKAEIKRIEGSDYPTKQGCGY
ncbi:hypothetical protein HWV62_16472 [Athelia sp. TMB]|nr:hypothetical protein HWV62_16472 [Athelia sp. TMB]